MKDECKSLDVTTASTSYMQPLLAGLVIQLEAGSLAVLRGKHWSALDPEE